MFSLLPLPVSTVAGCIPHRPLAGDLALVYCRAGAAKCPQGEDVRPPGFARQQMDEHQSPLHVSGWEEGAGLDSIFLEGEVKPFPGLI